MIIRTLQAGRALAAIAVVAFHLSIMMGATRYGGLEVFREYTKLGNYGVAFFFVLSGFIILFAHFGDIDKPKSWGNYMYRRFIRIYPIYWLYTSVFVLLLLFVGGIDAKIPSSFADWITSLSLIRLTDATPPLPPAWTLFHEVAFYGVFSVLILNRRVGIVAMGLFMLVSIVLYHYPAEDAKTPFNVYTAAYNLYFLFGMGAYWLYRRGGGGVAEFVFGVYITSLAFLTMPLPYELTPLFIVFGFALLLTGTAKLELQGSLRIPIFLGFIGDASYTIYLTHSNIMGILLKIAIKTHLPQFIGYGATYFAVLAGAVLLGCVAYLIIEKPLLKLCRRARDINSRKRNDKIKLNGIEST